MEPTTTETTDRDDGLHALYTELSVETAGMSYAEAKQLIEDAGVDYAEYQSWAEAQAEAYYTRGGEVWAGSAGWV